MTGRLLDRYEAAVGGIVDRYGFDRCVRAIILASWAVLLVALITIAASVVR